MPFDNKVQIVL